MGVQEYEQSAAQFWKQTAHQKKERSRERERNEMPYLKEKNLRKGKNMVGESKGRSALGSRGCARVWTTSLTRKNLSSFKKKR